MGLPLPNRDDPGSGSRRGGARGQARRDPMGRGGGRFDGGDASSRVGSDGSSAGGPGLVLACGGAATAEQIALSAIQAQAIRLDPGFAGGDYYGAQPGEGPTAGLGLARQIGHVSYRTELELERRFGREPQSGEDPAAGGRYSVQSYLDHQAHKLAARFDSNSYLILTRAMDHHDVGRGRGGLAGALASVTARVTVAGIDSDRLYPLRLQDELSVLLPERPPVQVISSPAGHDGFLIEADQVAKVVFRAIA
jgi:homoserine O-acetyltransferase